MGLQCHAMSRNISPQEAHKKCVIFEAIHSFFETIIKRVTSKTGPGSSMEANLYQICACDWNVTRLGRVIKELNEKNLVF